MAPEDDPLLQRAAAILAEAARLHHALEQSSRLAEIEADLDPLLPHLPEKPGRVRELPAQGPREAGKQTARARQRDQG